MQRLLVGLLLMLPFAAAETKYRDAVLLQYADFEYGSSHRSYLCVSVRNPDRLVMGYAKRLHWHYHPSKMKPLVGKAVRVRFDDESLWIIRTDGRALKLKQDYLTRAFEPDSRCEQVVEAAVARQSAPPKKLHRR